VVRICAAARTPGRSPIVMPVTARRLAAALILLFAAGTAAAPAPPPKLVVILVVDQMRGDYVDRFGFQWTGGLRRLVDEGAWFRRAAYPYYTTVTCAGHATISTGAYPRTHGIVSNGWFDRASGRATSCSADASLTTVSYAGPVTGGQGPARLLVPTLADELRAQMPVPARVVTMSMKDRTAIMLAGHRADSAVWFSPTAGGFVTSSQYTSAPVPFMAEALKARPVSEDYGKTWTRTLPAEKYLFADRGLGEKPGTYWTPEFPHALKGKDGLDAQFYDAWESSPFSDDYLGRLAIASVDALKLGQGPGTDFLGVSFSALDMVGHDFGPTSHEVQDVLVRLDRTVGALLAHLDRRVGAGKYVVAWTADHGASPVPQQAAAMGLDAGRLDTALIRQAATKALEAAFGPGTYTVRSQSSDLVLEPAVVEKLRRDPEALDALIAAIRAVPGVSGAYFGEQLDSHAAAGDRDARAEALSYFPGRSADVIVVPRAYWLPVSADGSSQPGSATSHGTMFAYDQHVPLVLFGSGIKPGEYLRAASPADIAPTLAFLCGVTLASTDGDVLVEAIAPPPARQMAARPAASVKR
jgi:predicted AlkP superfamily pyrophosphatase or phosphodiesterase